jgi:two-component system chemotaxis response regulator CheB
MRPFRVLIADDSAVARQLVTMAIAGDEGMTVAGIASDGHLALERVDQLQPDVVVLDVEMPGMNGLQAVAAIRSRYPRLPIIMFSSLTERGAMTTIEALSLGASDYVTKPAHVGGQAASIAYIQAQLLPRIRVLCAKAAPLPVPSVGESQRPQERREFRRRKVDLVVIGVSTGGPQALQQLIPRLPADLAAPVAIVQHMPALFTRQLADHLHRLSNLMVREAADGDVLSPGAVWLAPGDHHMRVVRRGDALVAVISQEAPVNYCRPAVDLLFQSAAVACGAGVLGLILTGMGADGRDGCRALHQAGAEILVQDEASSVVWGMPAAVVEAGLADHILPLDDIPSALTRRLGARAGLPGRQA